MARWLPCLLLLAGGLLVFTLGKGGKEKPPVWGGLPAWSKVESIEMYHDGGCFTGWGYGIRIKPSGQVSWSSSYGVRHDASDLRDISKDLVRRVYQELSDYDRGQSADASLLRTIGPATLRFEVVGQRYKWLKVENRGDHPGFDALFAEISTESGLAEWFAADPFLPPEPEPELDHPGFDEF